MWSQDLDEMARATGFHQIIIFFQWRKFMDLIGVMLKRQRIRHRRYDGA